MKKLITIIAGAAMSVVTQAKALTADSDTRTKADLMVADPMYDGKTIEQHRAEMRDEDAGTIKVLMGLIGLLVLVTVALAVTAANYQAIPIL